MPDPNNQDPPVLEIWDVTLDQPMKRLEPNLARGSLLKFSPDGEYLVFFSASGGIVYSTERYESVGRYTSGLANSKPAFLPGTKLLAYTNEHRILLWNCERRQYANSIIAPVAGYICASGDGNMLMTYNPLRAHLYSLAIDDEKVILSGHTGGIPGIAYDPDGTHLASVGNDQTLRVWDTVSGVQKWQEPIENAGQGVTYSANGKWLVTAEKGKERFCIWNTETTEQILELGSKGPAHTWAPELTNDNQYLLTVTSHRNSDQESDPELRPGSLAMWRCQLNDRHTRNTKFLPESIELFTGYIGGVALTPNNRYVAFSRSEHPWEKESLLLWERESTKAPRLLANGVRGTHHKVHFTSDSR